ncbi:unnamed protein product [Lathyrus oleraceus]|uniref:TF-B3 domain-containing protein n=1 Tax=Pisum sativum TaxID=3888 RepID=A0A9D4Y0E5_PEA|nr:B3 domain-containing transcription factor VRN1-like [Pisum sativum]KAI5430382.1 hypothetical protein KIW84_034823 [Pisum sativum]
MSRPLSQFFRIIVTEYHQQKKLVKPCMLPIKIVKKYGEGLAKVICLKTPDGEEWKINLVNNDGKIWFGKGWKEFTQYYSLCQGHLLMFKYQRSSEFHVDIFDNTTVEINYPLKRVEAEKVSNNEEDRRTSKKRKANSSFEFGSTSCAKHHPHKRSKVKQVKTTLERAKEFKTSNPSFILAMGTSYVESRYCLTIPCEFGKRHFDLKKKIGDIYFGMLGEERVWRARYAIKMNRRRMKFEVTGGWYKFSKYNNLRVGDVCNFELILKTDMTFQVHIFRKTNEDNSKTN